MAMYKPADCRFGLNEVQGDTLNHAYISILLSVPMEESPEFAEDEVDEDDIDGFPEWLKGRGEAEALYAAPDGWDRAKVKAELEALGFMHDPRCDAECVDGEDADG